MTIEHYLIAIVYAVGAFISWVWMSESTTKDDRLRGITLAVCTATWVVFIPLLFGSAIVSVILDYRRGKRNEH